MKITKIFFSIFLMTMFMLPGVCATRKQSAVNAGTKVAGAIESKSSPCQEKYDACMDMGCVLDNDSGGRCQCSNKIKELNEQLKQIQQDYAQSEKLNTLGVEKVKLGAREKELLADVFDEDEDDDDSEDSFSADEFGDKLRAKMHKLCAEKLPECESQMNLIKNMYAQKVKSDCAAYENALKDKARAGRSNLAAAQKNVRDAALNQYSESNKYNLGQCTAEFKKCMQVDAECGNDFTGCVDTVAKESVYGGVKNTVEIVGENTSIKIAASTMDMLESKRLICEKVLYNCVNVKDKVWESFLKNSAYEIKLAESKSESNLRNSCLDKISNCFVNACKENINGTDSYDMCLTRPETVKSLCKVELEPCLAATGGSYDEPEKSTLWPSVLAKLSAMRVDSCTAEMKSCLQSEDRCGADYSQCIGLDTNIIMRMCPYDKLVGCQKVYGETAVKGDAIYDEIAQMVEGIILNIDNEMLATCEVAVEDAMSKVCGDDESCAQYALGTNIGSQSLKYQVCQYSTASPDSTKGFKWFDCRDDVNKISDYELGRNKNATSEELGYVAPFAGVISGVIKWESVEITDDGMIDVESYINALYEQKDIEITQAEREKVLDELKQLQNDINNVIKSVETDNMVQYCITGRTVKGVTDRFAKNKVRFPKLSNTVRKNIATAALKQAKDNYYRKYDKLTAKMQSDLVKIQRRLAENLKLNGEDAAAAAANEACTGMAALSAFAKAPVGQALWAKIVAGIIIVAIIIVATIFTCGAAGAIAGGAIGALFASTTTTTLAAGTLAGVTATVVGEIGAAALISTTAVITTTVPAALSVGAGAAIAAAGFGAATAAVTTEAIRSAQANKQMVADTAAQQTNNTLTHGEYYANEWNYQEKITTDYDAKTGVCKRCISKRQCEKTKWSLFSKRSCKKWADDEFTDERCTEMKF